MHDPLAELPTTPRAPIGDEIRRARRDIRRAVADVLEVPHAALERPWRWRPDDPREVEVRWGVYRLHEILEEASGAIERARLRDRSSLSPAPALPPLVASGAARWELHGALAGLPVAAWDADPGGGEWSVRRTLAHVISTQRALGWTTAWFLDRAGTPQAGEYAPDGALPPEPDEESDADGAPDDVADRLDALVDQQVEVFGGLGDDDLAVPGRWYGLPITVDFRLARLGSHIREHTIQVDKTVAMLGLEIPEVARIARVTLATFGRVEGLVIGRPRDEVATDLAILEAAARSAAETAADVRAVAGRAVAG